MNTLACPTANRALHVLACDAHLVVVDKPAGLPSVPGRDPALHDCAWSRVRERVAGDALVVHRLDMATSGVLVFARGLASQRALSIAFAERRVAKRYVAEVDGLVEPDAGTIDAPLRADWPNRPRQIVDAIDGKPALTHWRVKRRDIARQRTLVDLEPVTGRSHQLRVHLHALGHPIVGDALYAVPSAQPPPAAPGADAPRLHLHAKSIELAHPHHGQRVIFESEWPPWIDPRPPC